MFFGGHSVFEKLQAPNPKGVCPTQIDSDHRKKKQNGACRPEIEIAMATPS